MEFLVEHWAEIADEAKYVKEDCSVSSEIRSHHWQEYDLTNPLTRQWISGWTGDPGWLNFGLIYLHKKIPFAQEKCPRTMRYLEALAQDYDVQVAGFSWLRPKTGIPPHRDRNEGYLTYHLGLHVPSKCYLITNNKKYEEANGRLLIFDSNEQHSAFNASSEDRIILYLLARKL